MGLPEVSQALQVFGGLGVLGATVAYMLKTWGDWRQRRRERRGLLRLLLVEIEQNERQLRAFRTLPDWITDAPVGYLRSDAWEGARLRLAELLENEEVFSDIAQCYDIVLQIQSYRTDLGSRSKKEVRDNLQDYILKAIDRSQKAAKHIRRSLPKGQGAYLPR